MIGSEYCYDYIGRTLGLFLLQALFFLLVSAKEAVTVLVLYFVLAFFVFVFSLSYRWLFY